MSVISHDTGKAMRFPAARKAMAGGARLLGHASETFAEAGMQKALIEAELCGSRYLADTELPRAYCQRDAEVLRQTGLARGRDGTG